MRRTEDCPSAWAGRPRRPRPGGRARRSSRWSGGSSGTQKYFCVVLSLRIIIPFCEFDSVSKESRSKIKNKICIKISKNCSASLQGNCSQLTEDGGSKTQNNQLLLAEKTFFRAALFRHYCIIGLAIVKNQVLL